MAPSTTPLIIPCGDVHLAARLHPAAGAPSERRPTVIVAGSWLTVKEQMSDLYAARLAALGYHALIFDFSGFGASGGTLRQAELPARKIADLRSVAAWVSTTTLAPPGGIAAVAVCASAQYTLAALAEGLAVDAFAASPAGSTTPTRWPPSTVAPTACASGSPAATPPPSGS